MTIHKDQTQMYQLGYLDDDFPSGFELLKNKPSNIFAKGKIPQGNMVAIVGSRKADKALLRFTYLMAQQLAQKGIIVVSGGALGIDTAAHKGALEAGGQTIAVIGSGFDHIYPSQNKELFESIAINGAIISEFTPNTPPAVWTFPKRNRLVAAMVCAVIVVQAAAKSGALITANIAQELGVPVGAVPASPLDLSCRGCNNLISNGAKLISSASDVISMIKMDGAYKRPKEQLKLPVSDTINIELPSKPPQGLSSQELKIWKELGTSPLHINEISTNLKLSAGDIGEAILNLELAGIIEDCGSKYFIKI